MYNTILVPVDLADLDKGKATLDIAKKLGNEGCKIRLLNVVEDIPSYVAAELPAGLVEKSIENAKQTLDDVAAASTGKVEVDVRAGHAKTVILTAAEECGADLIIIGSHRPGLQDYLLGSTAGRVVRHSTCSVLVVR
ncbi:MAG: universal stress protein [Rhizobiales bacterium]|nr:universal stress protein [Hyphomicrobiales bacterium]